MRPEHRKDAKFFSTIVCEDKKLHGASKSLEVSAALTLYRNSTEPDFPFRYKIYVGDGD